MLPTLQKEFTFQYVSILIPLDFLLALSAQIFTFQYVSILIYFVNHSFIINLFIYIPICFYFNKKCKKLLIISTKSFTFQYVSILIIVAVLFPIFCKNIYIPICFYFNPSPEFPLLFYLISPLSVDQPKFTNILPYLLH